MQYHNEIFLPLLPYTHFYGLSILFIWYFTEGTLTIYKHHHPRNTLYKIISSSVTIVDASPSLYTSLIKFIENKQLNVQNQFAKVKMWCIGGAPLTRGLDNKFKNLFNKPLLNGYGLTEIGNVALANITNYIGCGQILPPFQVKIYNESREPLPMNEIGEISIYVPFNINDYNNNVLNSDGWYHTDNNLFVIGRSNLG
ncbi:AMP-binding protein [Virgibacillus proomii]|uniref:AMP-binding protein n=1 Tax=Virgibacillus proomii TaxID=84407 RepID=UPI001C100177|nr:AMP-binding protein [Virgibacillus proomii]MBU5267523.1 AMP-binding protein [Virgibacillus proomii]